MTTPQDLAEKAAIHILRTLREYPERFYLLGDGTETYIHLTEFYALKTGKTVEEVEKIFRPPTDKWERWLEEKKSNEALLSKARANQDITVQCETPPSIDFDSWWRDHGQFLEPVASLSNVPNDDGKSDRELIEQFRLFAKASLDNLMLLE